MPAAPVGSASTRSLSYERLDPVAAGPSAAQGQAFVIGMSFPSWQDIELDAVGRQFEPYAFTSVVSLWCDMGCCSKTVVGIKAAASLRLKSPVISVSHERTRATLLPTAAEEDAVNHHLGHCPSFLFAG